MASFDTWIKQYRPDENTPNVNINYYPKGAVVAQVRRGTPAHEAGLNVDDEVVAIDQVRVRADGLNLRLEQYKPGDQVSVTVARRDRLIAVPVTLGADPGRPWRLEVRPDATDDQKRRVAAWVGE